MAHEAVESQQGVLSADEALRFLDEAAAVLVGSLDYERTIGHVAQLVVPTLADWCAVDVLEEDGSLRQITSGHPDPEQEQLLADLRRRYRAERGASEGVTRVVASGEPELFADVRGAERARVSLRPEESELYDRLGPKSYLIVPLAARGRTLGALTLLSTRPGRHYSEPDLAFAMHLARRSSLAIDNARLYDAAESSLGLLDTLFTTAPVGLGFVDTDLRFVRINDALAQINGLPAEDHLGRTVAEVLGPLSGQVEPVYTRVLAEGIPVLDHEISALAPGGPDDLRHWIASFTPVRGLDGQVIGVGSVVIDVTDRRRALEAERAAGQRAAFLAEAGALLDASLELSETLDSVARLAVPDFADWCTVLLLDDDTGELRQVSVAHSDPAKVRWAWELQERYPPDSDPELGVGKVIATGQPDVVNDITDEMLVGAALDQDHLRILRELGLTATVIAPLRAGGRTLGAITFISTDSGRHYGDAEVELLVELGRRAGVAVENARLYTERSRIAHTLQARLLPSVLPQLPGFRLAARYRAAGEYNEVGGDFYDAFERAPGELAVVIGDVSGKGPEAAALTALARYTIRSAALNDWSPAHVLRQLNDMLLREEGSQFVTVALAYLRRDDDGRTRARLVLAGHPLPYVVRAGGGADAVGEPGTLLGIRSDIRLSEVDAVLELGDALVLYTDGVIEAGPRDAPLGEEGLRRVLAVLGGSEPQEMLEAVDAAAQEVAPGRARDDVALLAIAPAPAAAPEELELTLAAEPRSLRDVRDAVVEFARQVPGVNVEEVRLAVGEACANVVVHAYRETAGDGPIHVRALAGDGRLVVEVRDEGCGPSPREDSPGLGLGMPLMARLTRELHVADREPHGTLVRLTF